MPSEKELELMPWIEKYRPVSVSHVILPAGMKSAFTKCINTKTMQNMLFYSTNPGTGKTSTAKALCRDMGIDYLYINTSLNRGIDTLRDDISAYATSLSIDGSMKVAILDEFDGSNDILQKAMRAAMEEFTDTCRFILTCNNISLISEPIKSRCAVYDFNFLDDKTKLEMIPKINKRVINILDAENVKYDAEMILKFIETSYPDIRNIIKVLEQFYNMYGFINADLLNYKTVEDQFYKLVLDKKVTEVRQFIINHGYTYDYLYRSMFDNIVPKIDTPAKRAKAIIIIADYMDKNVRSIDKEITFTACLIDLIDNQVI